MNDYVHSILIIDDNDSIRKSLMYFFEDFGWKVFTASDAEEALVIVGKENPEGAIVDIRLPGMDGNDFIRKLIKMGSNMACILCSGSPEYKPPEDIAPLPQVYDNIFPKPVMDMLELKEALQMHIENCC